MMNCLVEAAVQEAYKECGCYPGYLVLSNNTCFGDSFRCFRRVFNDLGIKVSDTFEYLRSLALNCLFTGLYRTVDDQGEKKTCMAACIDQTFSVTLSSNNFPGEESFNHRHGFCIIVRSCNNNNNLVLIAD